MWLELTQWANPPLHGVYLLKAPIYWMVMAGLIVATFIDFEHYIIPNEITFGGILAGLFLSAVYPPLQPNDMVTFLDTEAYATLNAGVECGAVPIVLWGAGGWICASRHCRVWQAPVWEIRCSCRRMRQSLSLTASSSCLTKRSIGPTFSFGNPTRYVLRPAFLNFGDKQFTDATVIVQEDSITINGEPYPLAGTGIIEAKTGEIRDPTGSHGIWRREITGGYRRISGLGSDLVFPVPLVGGRRGGGSRAGWDWEKKCCKGRSHCGRHIALGALVWLFAEDQLLAIMATYLENVKDLLTLIFSRG